MWINSSETLPLSFLLYACFDPSLFVTKYAFLSERVWAIWNQVVLSTSIYWAFTVCYTLLGRNEAKIDEWIRVKLAESTRRALCAFFKTPLQRSHFSPSLPQEGFQIAFQLPNKTRYGRSSGNADFSIALHLPLWFRVPSRLAGWEATVKTFNLLWTLLWRLYVCVLMSLSPLNGFS